MAGNLTGPTLVVIVFIVLLLFGAPKLPALARSLGQSMRILKKEVTSDGDKPEEGTAKSEAPETDTAKPADSTKSEKPGD
ncbi:twin-arginine translocase TatA/TatE family subunit [Leucobacter weissii]|uniref:Sec-independent protein translocase protein TatA n=1 Tax=Leucobacter weissii TaxID=1983706 RepID=A0A939MIN9_9MICO|nr:twin-arginine translocase TatA/TatE family subunit [Leucobacter weissii]MBO1901638.1 twin-arginine translocase TatA/TatE family subunit [Leucobacter weissii]